MIDKEVIDYGLTGEDVRDYLTYLAIKRFSGQIIGSEAAKQHFGIVGVCEPCALIAGRRTTLIL